MLNATRDLVLPTTITGSYPRPHWFTEELRGRGFKDALGDSRFREQYLDAVACLVREQEMAGLDFVTDGDSRFDLTVGGKSWFYYVIERLARHHRGPGPLDRRRLEIAPARPHPLRGDGGLPARGGGRQARRAAPLQYAPSSRPRSGSPTRPVKFGAITAQSLAKMLVNRHYGADRDVILALADIFNAELKEVAAAGCRVIQVEEPQHHIAGAIGASDKDLEFYTESVNREIAGVDTEIWLHTCWGNPNQQPLHWERPSYERSLPYLLATDADVLTLECASTNGRDLPLLGKHRTDKKIAIGVVNHSTAAVEPPEVVAA